MPIQVVIPDNDPLVSLLEVRAVRRGLGLAGRKDRPALRKRLPKLARELIRERLGELNTHGDPMETATTNYPPASPEGPGA